MAGLSVLEGDCNCQDDLDGPTPALVSAPALAPISDASATTPGTTPSWAKIALVIGIGFLLGKAL